MPAGFLAALPRLGGNFVAVNRRRCRGYSASPGGDAVNGQYLAVSWSMWRWILLKGGYVMENDTGCAEFLVGTPRGFEE